jgi:hypothetical protein
MASTVVVARLEATFLPLTATGYVGMRHHVFIQATIMPAAETKEKRPIRR